MKVLFVLTSHSELGNTGMKTGFWVEEFAAPYYVMADEGVEVTIASPKGGQPPIDPKSEAPDAQTEATKRYYADRALKERITNTKKLAEVDAADFDAIFFPGGHGPMWDLYDNKDSIALIQDFWSAGKPVAAVCHAPSALLNVKDENGDPLVKGKKVTGFTNTEEEGVKLTDVVPYLLEDELKARGGKYSSGSDWSSHVVKDGMLITGQNPASSEKVAKELLALLEKSTAS
ncbi:MAG: type 1 glutamine amidotransferase domain-containing protein [Bacteroidota bacterium]|nr:type 1 glutamine amidotransferase domain-containing protein [Bacteroidota bacterium]